MTNSNSSIDPYNINFSDIAKSLSLGQKSLLGLDLSDLFKPMPFWKLMKRINKIDVRAEKLTNKVNAAKLVCANRAKAIPKNATIRKEYVKCKKPDCCYDRHGPYYYVYWKDPESKKLKKKYIGQYLSSSEERGIDR